MSNQPPGQNRGRGNPQASGQPRGRGNTQASGQAQGRGHNIQASSQPRGRGSPANLNRGGPSRGGGYNQRGGYTGSVNSGYNQGRGYNHGNQGNQGNHGRGRGQWSHTGGGGGGGMGRGRGSENLIYQPLDGVPPFDRTRVDGHILSLKKLPPTPTIVPPRRPGYGTQGIKSCVRTNYFKVKVTGGKKLYMYDVHIEPDVTNKKKRKRLFQLLEESERFKELLPSTATDYGQILVSSKKFEKESNYPVVYSDVGNENAVVSDKDRYQFKFKHTSDIELSEFQDFVEGKNHSYNTEKIVQAMNIILAKYPSTQPGMNAVGMNKLGNKSFITEAEYNRTVAAHLEGHLILGGSLVGNLIALKGFYTSIRPCFDNIMCNLNVCTTAFYKAENVATAIQYILRECQPSVSMQERKRRLEAYFKRVRITYQPVGKNTYVERSITGFGFRPKDCKITNNDYKTVEEYWEKQGRKILQSDLPCVNVGSANSIYIPPEFCKIVPGQPFTGKLDVAVTSEMINIACKTPMENATLLETEAVKKLGFAGEVGCLGEFNIKIDPKLTLCPARILESPTLLYSNQSSVRPNNSSWNLSGNRFLGPVDLPKWAIIAFRGATLLLDDLTFHFKEGLRSAGMGNLGSFGANTTPNPPPLILPNLDKKTILEAFRRLQADGCKLVYVVLPSKEKDIYAYIKSIGDKDFGITTVCSAAKSVGKLLGRQPPNWAKTKNYFINIALKINLKIGGINHRLQTHNTLREYLNSGTMIIGCDVTHPSPGSPRGTPSIAGVVASFEPTFSQYPASLRMQGSRVEIIGALKDMVSERLDLFYRKNKTYPQRILVYRDGVSEGQYQQVLDEELPQIQNAVRLIKPPVPHKVEITVVVVGKRHHTRFYPTNVHQSVDSNPTPGTVVDTTVTSVYDHDFFLQSHKGLRGTARPAHYYVVHDENGINPDNLQLMTYHLSYQFGRATKSVSVCPPAYYADLACERGRCYLNEFLNNRATEITSNDTRALRDAFGNIHGEIKDTMFYL